MSRKRIAIWVVYCVASAASAAFGQGASFQGLGDLSGGAFSSDAWAVSADGTTVVGSSLVTDDSPFGTPQEAFRWTAAESMVGIGDLDTAFVFSRARDVSGDGSVIVGEGSLGASDQNMRPYRWTQATGMVQLVDPSGVLELVRAEGVSADGLVIVGHANPPTFENLAYLWTQSQGAQSLGALPNPSGPDSFAFDVSADGSVITGCSISGGLGNEAFVWTQAKGLVGIGDVPGGNPYAIAWGISPDGKTIVGSARQSFPADEAFIWSQAGGFIFPDPLHAAVAESAAFAASEDGSIVVGYDGNVGGPMIWDATHGARNIQTVLTNVFGLDLTGWSLNGAADVSADGTVVVGTGTNPLGQSEAWIARIPRQTGTPLPASSGWAIPALLLSLTAGAGLVFRRMSNSE